MPVINVENAQIRTAGIEVKSLTLNGKQVTLSVFKQIIEENIIEVDNYPETEIIDETKIASTIYSLNGIPWGIVHYFWQKEIKEPNDYLHVLWQKGKELRRCIIKKDKKSFIYDLEQYKYETWTEDGDIDYLTYYKEMSAPEWNRKDPQNNYTEFELNLRALKKYRSEAEYNMVYDQYLELKKIQDYKRECIKKDIENLDKVFLPLLDLPQLFIAV